MERPTKCRDNVIAKLREEYLSVLNEPVPPRIIALVEKLRELERAKKPDDGTKDAET